MIRPPEAGQYRVTLTNGHELDGYYISRHDLWVTLDGACALEVVDWKPNADDDLRLIIIAGNRKEAERYMRRHGLSWHQVAHQFPARGWHYDRIVLVGSWRQRPNLEQEVNDAMDAVWPRRTYRYAHRPHQAAENTPR